MKAFVALSALLAVAAAAPEADPTVIATHIAGVPYTGYAGYAGYPYAGIPAGYAAYQAPVAAAYAPVAAAAPAPLAVAPALNHLVHPYDYAGQIYPLAEPYIHSEVAAEPYVHEDIAAEPYVHTDIAAAPYVHEVAAPAPAAVPYVHTVAAPAPVAGANAGRAAASLQAAVSQQEDESVEVESFLAGLSLDRYTGLFLEHGFDCMEVVSEMTEEHMREIGMELLADVKEEMQENMVALRKEVHDALEVVTDTRENTMIVLMQRLQEKLDAILQEAGYPFTVDFTPIQMEIRGVIDMLKMSVRVQKCSPTTSDPSIRAQRATGWG